QRRGVPTRPRRGDGGAARDLHLQPRGRDPRRGERVVDRAARRRPDAELPGLGRALRGRWAGRCRRHPGSVLTLDELEPLDRLLRRHHLEGIREEPFPNDGWSGASMSLLRRGGGDRFVLKHDSLERDWIARSTADRPLLREAWFAAHGPELPPPLRAPYLGAARDGDGVAILMPDLTGVLFDWDAPISVEALNTVLASL